MSSLIQQACILSTRRSPLAQFQRYRGKINIQRPKKPHYERARVMAATIPRLPDPPKTRTCFQPASERYQKQIDNPYDLIIAREALNWFKNSRTVGIFHLNSIAQEDLFPTRVKLHQQNIHIKIYGKKIIKKAVENTVFEAIVPLFDSYHCIAFSPEQKVSQLLRLTRKVPQMILIAGIVDGRLLSRNEMVAYSQLPNLQTTQAELVQTLNMAASNVVQQLEAHQNSLVNILDVYAKSEDPEKLEDPTSSSNENVK